MPSIALFTLLFALAAKATAAPQIIRVESSSGPKTESTTGSSVSASLTTPSKVEEINLNAADHSASAAFGPTATPVPFGSTSCDGVGGNPGENCPFINAPPDGTCVEYTQGSQFWLGGYRLACGAGTHCDMALGGNCNGRGSPWLSKGSAAGAYETGAAASDLPSSMASSFVSEYSPTNSSPLETGSGDSSTSWISGESGSESSPTSSSPRENESGASPTSSVPGKSESRSSPTSPLPISSGASPTYDAAPFTKYLSGLASATSSSGSTEASPASSSGPSSSGAAASEAASSALSSLSPSSGESPSSNLPSSQPSPTYPASVEAALSALSALAHSSSQASPTSSGQKPSWTTLL